jgi:hypothetical protein
MDGSHPPNTCQAQVTGTHGLLVGFGSALSRKARRRLVKVGVSYINDATPSEVGGLERIKLLSHTESRMRKTKSALACADFWYSRRNLLGGSHRLLADPLSTECGRVPMKIVPRFLSILIFSSCQSTPKPEHELIYVNFVLRFSSVGLSEVEFLPASDCSLGGERFNLEVSESWKEAVCLLALPEVDWIYDPGNWEEASADRPRALFVSNLYDPDRRDVIEIATGEWSPPKFISVEEALKSPPKSKSPGGILWGRRSKTCPPNKRPMNLTVSCRAGSVA